MANWSPAHGSERGVRHVYGLDIGSRFPFMAPLPKGAEPSDLELEQASPSEISAAERDLQRIYSSVRSDDSGRSLFEFWSRRDEALLRFVELADFLVSPGSIRWSVASPRSHAEIEALLLSSVLAYWLESSGILALHASAVVVDGRAIAFLGDSGMGKSWVSTAMLLAGFSLLSDDILPVETKAETIRCRAGYPQIKSDERMGRHALGEAFSNFRVIEPPERRKRGLVVGASGFGKFHSGDAPLGCVYSVVRDESGTLSRPLITELSRREALLDLIRFSFIPRLVEGLGWQPRRLDQLARLTGRVAVRRLTVPHGLTHVDSIAPAIVEDSRA